MLPSKRSIMQISKSVVPSRNYGYATRLQRSPSRRPSWLKTYRVWMLTAALTVLIVCKLHFLPEFGLVWSIKFSTDNNLADIAFVNGFVYTADSTSSNFSALAIKDGIITYIGSTHSIENYISRSTKTIDLQGRMLMPGLIDAHTHTLTGGRQLLRCNLEYALLTHSQFQHKIQACLEDKTSAISPSKWLEVVNWDRQAMSTLSGDTTKAVLDALNTSRPIAVRTTDGHSAMLNTIGLVAAGIDSSTPDPVGGEIIKDEKGNPTGILEDEATSFISAAIPIDNPEDMMAHGRAALQAFREVGITTFQDAYSELKHGNVFNFLYENGELTSRASFCIGISSEEADSSVTEVVTKAVKMREAFDQKMITAEPGIQWRSVKLSMDGILQTPSQTASLLEPYFVKINKRWIRSNHTVQPYMNTTQTRGMIGELLSSGFDIQVHAIGDNSVRSVLNAVEDLNLHSKMRKNYRVGIAHAELVHPDDYDRFGRLETTLIMSYQWAQRATYWDPDTVSGLGRSRLALVEPFGSLQKSNAKVIYGSDWPVDPLDPFLSLKIGVVSSHSKTHIQS